MPSRPHGKNVLSHISLAEMGSHWARTERQKSRDSKLTRTFEAIYEDGALKPIEPVSLPEGERVKVTITIHAIGENPPENGSISDSDSSRHWPEWLRRFGPVPDSDL